MVAYLIHFFCTLLFSLKCIFPHIELSICRTFYIQLFDRWMYVSKCIQPALYLYWFRPLLSFASINNIARNSLIEMSLLVLQNFKILCSLNKWTKPNPKQNKNTFLQSTFMVLFFTFISLDFLLCEVGIRLGLFGFFSPRCSARHFRGLFSLQPFLQVRKQSLREVESHGQAHSGNN